MAKSKQPTPTEALRSFLNQRTHPDLACMYSYGMEVQVNVAQDDGEQIQQTSGYTGRIWSGYTDGLTTWKSFRIPWNAATEPEYNEENREMRFDLAAHAEGRNDRMGLAK